MFLCFFSILFLFSFSSSKHIEKNEGFWSNFYFLATLKTIWVLHFQIIAITARDFSSKPQIATRRVEPQNCDSFAAILTKLAWRIIYRFVEFLLSRFLSRSLFFAALKPHLRNTQFFRFFFLLQLKCRERIFQPS